jgi:hypothetical protein
VPRSILLTCQYSYDIAQGRQIEPAIAEQGFAELAIRAEAAAEAAAA